MRQRRLRAAQPRHRPLLQRVQRDSLPQRHDLLRPHAAGSRPRAFPRQPRHVRRARSRPQGVDPRSRPHEIGTRRWTPSERIYRKCDMTKELIVIGTSWGGLAALQSLLAGLPGRSRRADRRRAAPEPRLALAGDASSLAPVTHDADGVRGRRQGRRSRPGTCTSLRPTTTCSSSRGRSALGRRARAVQRGRRSTSCSSRRPTRTASAQSASCSPGRTRTAPSGLARIQRRGGVRDRAGPRRRRRAPRCRTRRSRGSSRTRLPAWRRSVRCSAGSAARRRRTRPDGRCDERWSRNQLMPKHPAGRRPRREPARARRRSSSRSSRSS